MATKQNSLGCKYQIYENGESKIYRVIKYKNDTTVTIKDTVSGDTKNISTDDLRDNYIRITPQAYLNVMLTDADNSQISDIYIMVFKGTTLAEGKTSPNLLLRQAMFSVSKNTFSLLSDIYVGDCITADMLGSNETIDTYIEYKQISYSQYVCLYLDDTLDDIVAPLASIEKKAAPIFEDIKNRYGTNKYIVGYKDSIRGLMEENLFINKYRSIFNIWQVDWIIDENNTNEIGNIILPNTALTQLEDMLRKYISNVIVIRYDGDIDINKIVSRKHIVISDANEVIYLIAYDEVGDYPVDEDIRKALGV